ncbi:MAG: helix-turn-helix domain-containing protein [Methanobacteriota archaeon]|nr:MAG: helix-turn-helix domain-containing protein [Euryarchaeota archaeon]
MEKIAGEIAISDEPGRTMRKWREEMKITVKDLSHQMGVTPSVISDYESGRRRSPGVHTIKRLVESMLEVDARGGGRFASRWNTAANEAIPSMAEFGTGVPAKEFLAAIGGKPLTKRLPDREIRGYTVIDSIKAITGLGEDYLKIFGYTTERALIFTGVKYGRSPMIVIRTHPLKPAMVVYSRPEKVDDLAVKLADLDNIILARTELDTDALIAKLERLP